MMKKATRKDLSPTVRRYLIYLMVYQYLPKLGGTNSDHFKRMEHAEKLLTKIHDERGVSTLQQQLHNAIEYIWPNRTKLDRGRKSQEEKAAEATPTFLRVMCPRGISDQIKKKRRQQQVFFREIFPKTKRFGLCS